MAEEIEIEEGEFSQSTEEIEALANEQAPLVEYVPKSKAPFRLNTLIPRNMAFEVQKSLNTVVKKHGNIDNYVRNGLKYKTVEGLWKALGAEQVDSLGMYLAQFERNQGIIIADQTGIGKGRQAAAVIRHAIMNDYLPVFFTRSANLFTDIYRDLKAIDYSEIHPFILNTDSDSKIKDEGTVVFSPLSSSTQRDLLVNTRSVPTDSPESIEWHKKNNQRLPDPEKQPMVDIIDTIDYLPSEYDCVFATYSQVQAAGVYKRLWLSKMIKAGIEGSKRFKKVVFVTDESHMAGGFSSIIGKWMRGVLPLTKSCCYLSATFAKYPEVMPFYGKKTAIQEANLRDPAFVASMEYGGLALQEIVASNLAESGQLIRRQRSNEGVKVEYLILDKEPARSINRKRVDQIIYLMNQIVAFEMDYVAPVLNEIHKQARDQGEGIEKPPKGLGVKSSPFFSRVFNIIDQLLFSLKVKEVAKKALELLREDKKVVIAFKSTMGAFLKDLNLASGDEVHLDQLDFARILIKGLDSTLRYNYTSIDNEKTRKTISLDELSENGRIKYNEIKQEMMEVTSGLSISPIDQLIELIEQVQKPKHIGGHDGARYKVAEVTGRNQRIRFEDGQGTIESFRSNAEKSFRLFNQGEYDVLLINQSGSTGASAHASKEFKDQRQRAMIIHQFELDINTEVQKRGRINRTGQIVLPEYYYITSDIPMEKRLMTMLKGKLKSLDANTTGSQKTNDDTLESADFFNKYGDKVAWSWVEENPDLVARMGHPTYSWKSDNYGKRLERNESKDGAIRQVTGRAGLLTVEDQERVYNELLARYKQQIHFEKQAGTYDLEVEFLKLDAEIKKRYLYQKGTGGTSPFGKNAIRDESIINNLKRPFTKAEIDERIVEALDGEKPSTVRTKLAKKINTEYVEIAEKLKKGRKETIENLEKERSALPETGKDTDQNEKIERDRTRLEELIEKKKRAFSTYELELEQILSTILTYIGEWNVGDAIKGPVLGTDSSFFGVFLGVKVGKSKNPYTRSNVSLLFAVSDSRRLLEYNLTEDQLIDIRQLIKYSETLKDEEVLRIQTEWDDLIKGVSKRREKRHIITENIIAASSDIGLRNRLVKYNTTDGKIKSGILMHRDFGLESSDRKALLPISDAERIIADLSINEVFADHQLRVKFQKIEEERFKILIPKKGNFELFTDQILRALIMHAEGQSEDEAPDFIQNAGDMVAELHLSKLSLFLERLNQFGLQYLGEAKEVEDWEEGEEVSGEQTTASFRYKLGRPYGQGSNPVAGFINYEEQSSNYPFGVVEYNRRLADSERFNYSLVPIFKNVDEPYLAWKEHFKDTPIANEFAELAVELKNESTNEAMLQLGFFITSNPHENGNLEFVFGKYQEEELGQAAYADLFGTISPIKQLIEQLTIALENG